jgi:PAS domain S-box-containing protein
VTEERVRRLQAGEKVSSIYEADFVCKDGTTVSVEARSRFIRDRAGHPIGILAIHRDITERKRMEEALRQSEARFHRMAINFPGGMIYQFLLRPDGSVAIPYISPSCQELYELEPEEIRSNPALIMNLVHPEDRAAFEQSIARSAQTLSPWRWEGRAVLESGTTKWFEGASRPEWQANGDILWDGLLIDITERKRIEETLRQTEEQYRSIFENAVEGIFQITPAGHILSASPALARMFGYESPEELQGQVANLNSLYVDSRGRAEVLQTLREQGIVREVEAQLYRKDGSTFWASLNLQAVWDPGGTIRFYEGSLEDMTKRRLAEQLKDEFVSVVSHELRTPLSSLRGSLGLLASGMLGPLPEKGQRMLEIAMRNTDRLVRLVSGHRQDATAIHGQLTKVFRALSAHETNLCRRIVDAQSQ